MAHLYKGEDLMGPEALKLVYTLLCDDVRIEMGNKISRELKGLARELQVPVLALSQVSRAVDSRADHKPMLSDLRESGSIEQDADVVILLHRDDYYDKESPRAGEADFIVAKHRNGPTGQISLFFNEGQTRFVDLARSSQDDGF